MAPPLLASGGPAAVLTTRPHRLGKTPEAIRVRSGAGRAIDARLNRGGKPPEEELLSV